MINEELNKLLKGLERLVGFSIKGFKDHLFVCLNGELEFYDAFVFHQLFVPLNVKELTKISAEGFQDKIYFNQEIDNRNYEITLKGTKKVNEFFLNYPRNYEIKCVDPTCQIEN